MFLLRLLWSSVCAYRPCLGWTRPLLASSSVLPHVPYVHGWLNWCSSRALSRGRSAPRRISSGRERASCTLFLKCSLLLRATAKKAALSSSSVVAVVALVTGSSALPVEECKKSMRQTLFGSKSLVGSRMAWILATAAARFGFVLAADKAVGRLAWVRICRPACDCQRALRLEFLDADQSVNNGLLPK